jgi:purine-binding chemotaxis protein CheW
MSSALNENYLEEDTQKGKFLTFNLEEESYGIEIKHVTEIIGILPITVVPELPDFIKGIVNLRGKIIPVMDMRLKFKKDYMTYNERTCIIVVDVREHSVGLIVDSVAEVTNIKEEDIVDQPLLSSGVSNQYIKSIGKVNNEVKLLLDCEKLLSNQEYDMIFDLEE